MVVFHYRHFRRTKIFNARTQSAFILTSASGDPKYCVIIPEWFLTSDSSDLHSSTRTSQRLVTWFTFIHTFILQRSITSDEQPHQHHGNHRSTLTAIEKHDFSTAWKLQHLSVHVPPEDVKAVDELMNTEMFPDGDQRWLFSRGQTDEMRLTIIPAAWNQSAVKIRKRKVVHPWPVWPPESETKLMPYSRRAVTQIQLMKPRSAYNFLTAGTSC